MFGGAGDASLNRAIAAVGEADRLELHRHTTDRTEVTGREQLRSRETRGTLEIHHATVHDRARRHDDTVVRIQGVDERAGDRLTDLPNVYAVAQGDTKRASRLDHQIERCG